MNAVSKIDITRISTAAVLGNLTISQWGAERIDRKQSSKVAVKTGAQRRRVAVTKKLVDRTNPHYKALCNAAEALRATHKTIGMPWDGKSRVLVPNEKIEDYLTAMSRLKGEFDGALAQLIDNLPAIQEAAKESLGSMFKATDFPTVDELRRLCSVRFNIEPVPTAGHFSLTFANDVLQQAATEFEMEVANRFEEGLERELSSLLADMQMLGENLGKSGKEGMIKDTMISRPREIARKLRGLNVLGNDKIERLCQRVEAFTDVNPDSLRDPGSTRSSAAREANRIAAEMAKLDYF